MLSILSSLLSLSLLPDFPFHFFFICLFHPSLPPPPFTYEADAPSLVSRSLSCYNVCEEMKSVRKTKQAGMARTQHVVKDELSDRKQGTITQGTPHQVVSIVSLTRDVFLFLTDLVKPIQMSEHLVQSRQVLRRPFQMKSGSVL